MIRIEILFPEVANLFGEPFNVKYLKQSLGEECEVIETALTETPAFPNGSVDLVYMGAMNESSQLLAINALKPYVEVMKTQIEAGKVFLFTGNAMEVLGTSITFDDKVEHPALGITPLRSRTDMMHRYNTLFDGNVKTEEGDIRIQGFKTTFSFSYGENEDHYFASSIRGCGINKQSTLEGYRIHNCIATYLVGPLLVLNPDLALYILKLAGVQAPVLAFEDRARECARIRAEVFAKEGTKYEL
ncbi:MAG: hypothetical protein HUJ69_05105 [Lachnospiraceae bacterium]|nr:hypothetical protein [Lachnospiraceae bacterium]